MTAHTLSMLFRRAALFVVITWFPLVPSSPIAAQASVPVLSSGFDSGIPGAITIRGDGFTPGGRVFVAVLDPWGERSYGARWTVASEPTFDMLGHDDPALGYRPGGVVLERFEHLCGQEVMVRAHDQATRSWSNVVDIASAC